MFLLGLDKSLNTIDHILDELLLRSSESSSVGDIEDTVIGFSVLSVNSSNLDVVFVGNLVEKCFVLHELWKLDVDGTSHGGTEVSWAGSDVSKMLVVGEFADSFNVLGGSAESVEDLGDSGTWLHGNDSELILLVDPDEESLGVVVENTSS